MYITKEFSEKSSFECVKEAYNNNELSIVIKDNIWWFEGTESTTVRNCVKREMKELYPNYKYIMEGMF